MDPIGLAIVLIVGIAASFIGSVAGGGGGLLSIPVLILMGLPPNIAIATNRFGSLGLAGSSIYKFAKSKKIIYSYAPVFIILAIIGSIIGANLLLQIDVQLLSKIVGIFILLPLPLLFIKNKGLKREKPSKLSRNFGYAAYFLVAVYDAFFGAGTGLMAIYILVFTVGLPLIESMALDRISSVFSAVLATIIFAYFGIINYQVGIVLLIGMALGGYIGTRTAIKKGNKFVKLAFVIVIIASAIKLIFF